jgi:hypothetical protein
MSRGIGTNANLIFQDDLTVIYKYGNYNLNEEDLKDSNHIFMMSLSQFKEVVF